MHKIFLFLSLSASILLVVVGSSQAATYSNFVNDGGWKVDSSALECRMTNKIPFYGDAVFRKRAGEDSAEFSLRSHSGRFATGQALLTAEEPVWKPEAEPINIGEVAVKQGDSINLGERYTERMLAELLQGREIVFSHSAWYGTEGRARLAITNVAFRSAYNVYLNCLAGLLPVNYDQIERTAIYFASGDAEELPPSEIVKLEYILQYAQVDPQLTELYIDGHTDNSGTREDNLILAEARAKLVEDYLVGRGMPEERIVTRWHGERYPVKSNGTSGDKAQNRRVTIRLERTEQIEIPPLATSAR